jgi:hypothetical protein
VALVWRFMATLFSAQACAELVKDQEVLPANVAAGYLRTTLLGVVWRVALNAHA